MKKDKFLNTDIVDFHSHILPCVDDGSKSFEQTTEMLCETSNQGIKSIVATPHFYASSDIPEKFFKRREAALTKLLDIYNSFSSIPDIYIGAEVAYFPGMGNSSITKDLCIVGTDKILVEMPFDTWNDSVIEDIILLRDKEGLFPIIAHIERYIKYQEKGIIEFFRDNGILIQSNAEFFVNRRTRKKALNMLCDGKINLIGSDCHNTSTRKQNIGEAINIISEAFGDEAIEDLESLSFSVLRNAVSLKNYQFANKQN